MTGLQSILYFSTAKSINSLDMKAGKLGQTVDLPDGFEFWRLTLDEETGLLAVASRIIGRSNSDTKIAFALYQSDPCLLFQQLLQVFLMCDVL